MALNRMDVVMLQQILAHDTGVLSESELAERNPDLDTESIRSHLESLRDRGLITHIDEWFAVTENGMQSLKQRNLWDEIAVWSDVYGHAGSDDSQVSDGERPIPSWY